MADNQNKAISVAIYTRVSTHYQIDKDSLPLQKSELTAYAKYVLNCDSFFIFEDAGYSAKNTERPEYKQMLSRVRKGEFTHILVWKLDRISRNLLDFAAMYDELKKLGVTFVSKNEQFDTSSAMGEAMLKIILVFAELERKMTAERVTATMVSRASNGQWNGGKIPFGYTREKGSDTFSIIQNEADIVRTMYSTYLNEHSLIKVTKLLNELGCRSRNGREWSPTTISIILKNPFYVGTYRYNYLAMSKRGSRQDIKSPTEWVVLDNHHPAIIDKAVWDTVNRILKNNMRGWQSAGATYNRKNTHIFAGLLYCGICGSSMSASNSSKSKKGGYRPSRYMCSSHRTKQGCQSCMISDSNIAPFILNYVSNMIKAKESFSKYTTLDMLQKKLLKGSALSEISEIKETGLKETYELYKLKFKKIKYTSPRIDAYNFAPSEKQILQSEKQKTERALSRLKSLYLFSDIKIQSDDFISEQKELLSSLETINARLDNLSDISSSTSFDKSDEFIKRASYYIMSKRMTDTNFSDFDKLARETDASILKDFINSVISKIYVTNGQVSSITFRNGITHEFLRKEN